MDVKSAFLNGYIMEEVYVKQPPPLENFYFPHRVSSPKINKEIKNKNNYKNS